MQLMMTRTLTNQVNGDSRAVQVDRRVTGRRDSKVCRWGSRADSEKLILLAVRASCPEDAHYNVY